MNVFNIEFQYQLYLKRMGLTERRMHPEQKLQLRHAFFGAWGQLLACMEDNVAALPEMQAIAVMEDMKNQVSTFFDAEVEKFKAKNN